MRYPKLKTCVVRRIGLWAGLLLALSGTVEAQWTTQRIELDAGWNTVFLHVQPEPSDCDTIFAQAPFRAEMVRRYKNAFSSVQYVADPSGIIDREAEWLTWVPADEEYGFIRNLHRLEVGKAYLLKLPDTSSNVVWELVGKPLNKDIAWRANAFNLVGFQVNDSAPPTFSAFFSASSALSNQPIYRLDKAGRWREELHPDTALLRDGEAFWIRARGHSDYQGPVRVETEMNTGLDYGSKLVQRALRIHNPSTRAQRLRLTLLPSQPAPPSAGEAAGDVLLSYRRRDWTGEEPCWEDMTHAEPITVDVGAGERWEGMFAVRRADMLPTEPGTHGNFYQSLLLITNDTGSLRFTVPVSAEGLRTLKPDGTSVHPYAGLWKGYAEIDRVSMPSPEASAPLKTKSTFPLRLILHVDAQGKAHLLPNVVLMWKDGTLKPDPQNPAVEIVDTPGRFVLVTDEALIPRFKGVTLRDGEQVGRRISSIVFGMGEPLPLEGNSGDPRLLGKELRGALSTDHDDRLNPFKHLYHPDHDNLDPRFEKKLAEGKESFSVERELSLVFARDPEEGCLPGWGDDQLSGTYRETIRGIHSQPIRVEGVFRLYQMSGVDRLNDGLRSQR